MTFTEPIRAESALPAQLLHALQFASPEGLKTALNVLNWPVDKVDAN